MNKCDQCIVRQLSSLKALNKEEIIKLANSKTTYKVKKGEALFEEGEVTNGVFCVKDGVGKLSKLSANGKDQIVKLVKSGELLGQRSMISNEPANLTAKAIADMEVCFIPKTEIINFFNSNNQFSLNMMQSVCEDLKESENEKIALVQKTVKQRLAETLLHLHDEFGEDTDKTLKVQLTREELAGIIGTATESCIRLLSDFNKSNLIELVGKKIKLKDVRALKKLADN
ncbi:CRP-like cAMP-binding protein [Flavobacterium nitrogenifigens]|uniref:CRP-like cAMP-binding protein n=2 Tax=Flavobacterium TaxID=237 RepID=A0A7W7N9A3_9FLAO|nr:MULTISPECIES: Crp/Fnr family transcriptional regulator [Flavobacterium]MBB4803281.1 CRP-like cAMP-binding protein [Flavobacterium nitrogenifigens]MBB6388239.1 CRP-like cAMP-binding protein [Flavobacterium notoginsengisoli]